MDAWILLLFIAFMVYAKAAIRTQPYDLLKWSSAYFRALANGEQPPVKERFDHPPFTHPTGLTPSYLRILFNQFGQPSYGSCVALKTLFRRWQGIALSDLLLYRILMIGHILKDEIDLYQFLAISCGLMGNNLLDTMILICEVLTEEPSGGSAMIPVKIMANLYGYLGSLDCTGKAPSENHEIVSNAVETYSPTCSVKDTLLPETISRETESICTYEVSEKRTHDSSNESFEASEQKITRSSVDVETLDDDKSQDDSAHWDEETDKTSTEVLENDGSTRSILDEAVKVQEETHLPPHDDNEPLLHTVHENSESSEGNANGELMNTEENVLTKTSAGEINEVEDGSEWVEHVRKQRDDNVEHPGLGNIREESCKCLVGEMRNVVDDGKKMKEERSKSPEVSDDEENDFAKVFVKRIEKNHSPLHVDYNVPGIGGTVSMERVNAVLVWLMDCSRRQDGMVGPRNLRHFMCPRLFDECNDDGDCNNYAATSVEVHFENKDGGFFLKHMPRQYYPSRIDTGIGSIPAGGIPSSSSSAESILSVDKFTVFQTSEPASVRATYGPFSTKQTVPARYIVPDPLEALPGPEIRKNITASNAALMDAQELGTRHLDMSAHLVGTSIPRDSPVLRVLFHAGSEAGGRRQLLLARHQRVCVLLHATIIGKSPLTAACSPDGEDGVCLAQITIPADWWPPLPAPDASGRVKLTKTPPRLVQVAYSVLEPRTIVIADDNTDNYGGSARQQLQNDATTGGCRPRVQIQPVTPLGKVPLVPNRAEYRELKTDESLTLLVPHGPLYPRSRLHVPAFLHSQTIQETSTSVGEQKEVTSGPTVIAVSLRARVKSGVKILEATSSNPNWILTSDINAKNTAATFTVRRKENAPRPTNTTAVEIMTMLLEASEEGAGSSSWDGGRIMWSVRYTLEGDEDDIAMQTRTGQSSETTQFQRQQQHHHHHHHVEKRKLQARLEIQKDDIQAVLPISKNWEVMNTAVLTGRQVSQAMKVFIVSQAGTVADVTLQSSCHSEDESVLKVSSSCSSVYVDGSEIRGSSNASVLVKYGTYTGLARFTVWMPEFPLEVTVSDWKLNQIKGWKVPEGHPIQKNKRSLNRTDSGDVKRRSVTGMDEDEEEDADDVDTEMFRVDDRWDSVNWIDRSSLQTTCRLRFQQSPVEVHARFLAAGHDSGRESYFVNRRTWLRVTDLVIGLLRVSDPRIAILLQDRNVQGRGVGRTEVQVLSPITGRVIGAKEIRVGNDRVTISRLSVKVVSGLQLTISPDTAIENGYVAETSVTRRLTAQYQEGLLDIDIEFSDGMRTPLREISVSDYHLVVESLDPEVVAFAPMVASHHPRVIAVGEGRGDLLRVTLQLSEACRMSQAGNRRSKSTSRTNVASTNLATATANVEVDFTSSDVPHRPEFVQNDGGGTVQGSSHHHRERKIGREVAPDLHDILIGGVGGVGIRHHSSNQMTPLEIGMYVLLAAFCFAIVVFVISCVVYASKFKPLPSDSTVPGHPVLGAVRARAAAASQQLSAGRRPRESTTNAHDWVWLGRATLERAACAPQQVRVTNNPLAGETEDDAGAAELGTSFDNPNHIELPTGSRPVSVPIDTTTYCKRDKPRSFSANKPVKNQATKPTGAVTASPRNGNDTSKDVPPPLPPHGIQPGSSSVTDTTNNNEDYKPPVPPHRNTGVNVRLPETPKKHPHRVSGSNHHGPNHRHVKHHHHHHGKNHTKSNKTDEAPSTVDNDEEFVELRNHEDKQNKETKSAREIKRATIVGNPMFSSSSSSSSQEAEEPVPLEDLNLGMDYNQIMQYFDNLKESNA